MLVESVDTPPKENHETKRLLLATKDDIAKLASLIDKNTAEIKKWITIQAIVIVIGVIAILKLLK